MSESHTFMQANAYIAYKKTVIVSITVPIVKEFITVMEVIIFEPVFHKQ